MNATGMTSIHLDLASTALAVGNWNEHCRIFMFCIHAQKRKNGHSEIRCDRERERERESWFLGYQDAQNILWFLYVSCAAFPSPIRIAGSAILDPRKLDGLTVVGKCPFSAIWTSPESVCWDMIPPPVKTTNQLLWLRMFKTQILPCHTDHNHLEK